MLSIGLHVVDWVAKKTNDYGRFGTDIGIGWLKNGELVAGVAYANWNGVNVECHIASDGSRRWLTRKYLETIFDYRLTSWNAAESRFALAKAMKKALDLSGI